MTANDNKKLTTDLIVRSPSLVLFAVLIAISIEFGIEEILQPNIEYGVFLNFIAFLITAIRFFHGNYIYWEKPREEDPGRFMANFYFNVTELIILCMAGRLVADGLRFPFALLALSIIDITWAIFSIFSSKRGETHNFWVWGLLNLATAIFLAILIILGYSAMGEVSIGILTFYIVLAILDYLLCRKYYFTGVRS